MTTPQPIEKPADDPRISAALAKIESLLTPGEMLGAYAVQRRYKALMHRLAIVATTSGRLIILNRGLLGGFKMTDVRWQDLANAQIDEGIFSSTLSHGGLRKLRSFPARFGRCQPAAGPGVQQQERRLAADLVLLAMGFLGPEREGMLAELGVDLDGRGNVAVDENQQTSVPGVFAAGDMARGQSLVVWPSWKAGKPRAAWTAI